MGCLTIHVAGNQSTRIEGHITTWHGTARPILTVRIGDLIVYCHDADSVDSFVTAWTLGAEAAPAVPLPGRVQSLSHSRHTAAIVLRVDGAARVHVNGIPAGASPTGTDVVRVRVGNLTVLAHDGAAVMAWNRAWREAEIVAETMWPRPDSFEEAQDEADRKVARHGRKAPKDARQRF
jgi:hypothetical protein